METIINIIIFIIGTVFGSFYTLATYRIPKKQDITHTRSYCPNCDHKLGFFDMFPIISYIILGGKCRYCGKKISPRYILLETLSGIVFLTTFCLMGINLKQININEIFKLCEFGFMALFISYIFITCGIDKENAKIEKSVSVYGTIISLMYIAYLCIVEKANIYRYAIYIVGYIILLIVDTINLKKSKENKYIYGLDLMLITMAIFTGEIVAMIAVGLTLLILAIKVLMKKIKESKSKEAKSEETYLDKINIAFYMGIVNIITYIMINAILSIN